MRAAAVAEITAEESPLQNEYESECPLGLPSSGLRLVSETFPGGAAEMG